MFLFPVSSLFLFSLDNTDGYDPDYDFLNQDLSVSEHFPTIPSGCLSPLPETLTETSLTPPVHTHARFSAPIMNRDHRECPPALPQKKRRSAPILSSYPLSEFRDEDTPTTAIDGIELTASSDSPPPLPEKKSKTSTFYYLCHIIIIVKMCLLFI